MLEDVQFDERVFDLVGTCNLMRISEVSVRGGQIGSDCTKGKEQGRTAAGKGDGQEVRNSKKEEMRKTQTPIRAICADIASGGRQE